MLDKNKSVLVTGIGGNVGQGILRNIRSSFPDIRLVGTNIFTPSAGNYLCDAYYEVPFATDEKYTTAIADICKKESIGLVIPATDYEANALSENKKKITAVIAVSPPECTRISLDKYLTYTYLKSKEIRFAESILPSEYKNNFTETLVKPRMGRGSKGISVNPENIHDFDDGNIVQPLLKGTEITTAFYVTKDGSLLGQITFSRTLSAGTTDKCEVCFEYDKAVANMILSILKVMPFRGACNIQSIVDETGNIIPFEINCRISGTNSIRSQFGFEDVKYTVEEYLYDKTPSAPVIKAGSAIRVLLDIIYPGQSLGDIENNKQKSYIF